MRISFITLFPDVFEPILNSSMLKRAQAGKFVSFELINLRDFGEGVHKAVDDRPYGGGAGMVLRVDILARALRYVEKNCRLRKKCKTILTSASGYPFNQKKACELSELSHLILVCGHYEGVDQRFTERFVDEELSIGDYVLTQGELPAMVIADAVTRLIPGVLKKEEARRQESFSEITHPKLNVSLLEYPHYTRPDEFEGLKVPSILLNGDHARIKDWRTKRAFEKTHRVRPDLLKRI